MEDNKPTSEEVLPPIEDTSPPAEASPSEAPAPDASAPPVVDTAPAPAEDAPVKASDAFRNRIKKANGDQDFSDDESFFQKASEELDNLEKYRNNNMEANKVLMEIFASEPAVPEVLKDMVKGASFREALARHFSPDELTPAEGDPDEEGWKKNAEARGKKLSDNEAWNKTKDENEEFSKKSIQEFAKETGLAEDQAQEFLGKVGEALDEVYSGKISKSFLSSMYKALNHETDVKAAETNGRIAGRNEKIDVKKESAPKGDGLPTISSGAPPESKPKKKSWLEEVADTEKKKQIL